MTHGYETPVDVHDHLDGSAYCVQCGGECKLVGEAMVLAGLVRTLFEGERYHGTMPYQAQRFLENMGLNVAGWRKAAREERAVPRIEAKKESTP